jgi:AraC-like DNA-binding protein
MNYEEFKSDLPRDGTSVFTSAEENEEVMRSYGVTQEIRQSGKGKFRCDLALRGTEQADLFADRFNKAFSMYLQPPEGTVGVLFPRSASGKFVASGNDVANEKIVVFLNGYGADIVAPDLVGSEAFTIPEARFIEMSWALCPTCAPPEQTVVIEGNPAELDPMRQALLHLVAHPETAADPEQVSNLLAATIAWVGHHSGDWKTEGLTVSLARKRVAKHAQEFIEEHHSVAVHIEDLCHVTGVGVRTLQRSFREYFDVTIMEYLKTVRLDAARRELLATHPSEATVATIALRNGLTHLGRFSVEFRERFGESPRDMLATRAGHKS